MIRLVFDCLKAPYDFQHILQVALALEDCEIHITGSASLNHEHPKILGKLGVWSKNIRKEGLPDNFPITYYETLNECKNSLSESGIKMIGTSPSAESSFFDLDLSKDNFAIVFGTEVGGLSKEKVTLMDELTKIPMSNRIDFMTLPVVVPIVAYEVARQQGRFSKGNHKA